MSKKKKIDQDEDFNFDRDNNDRPLTQDEINKLALKKKVKELREKSKDQIQVVVTQSGEVKKANELTIEEQVFEYKRCKLDPIYFIETYLTVFDQTKGDAGEIVPFKLFDFQKRLIKSYLKFKRNIANKYRQAGVSTATCAYIAWYVMFNDNRKVAVVADKLETARDELMSDIIDFIECCPAYLKPTISNKDTAHHKRYTNSSEMKAFATKTLRGFTATLIFWDETAWAENGDKFWTAAAPAVNSTGGRTIFVSTPNGLDSVFYATFDGAIKKKNDFNAVELWWYNDPRYNKDLHWVQNEGKTSEIRVKDTGFPFDERKKYADNGYVPRSPWYENIKKTYNGNLRKLAQEVECSFLGSGENLVAEQYIKRIEDDEKRDPIVTEWEDKGMYIFKEPEEKGEYVIGVDVSSGHGDDFSAVNILEINEVSEEISVVEKGVAVKKKIKRRKIEQVAEWVGKVSPQQLAEIVYGYGKRYNNAYVVIDVSGGWGSGTLEKLIEFGYPLESIHYFECQHKPTRDRFNSYAKTSQKEITPGNYVKVDLIPGFMIGQNRASVLQEMERAVRMQDVIIRSSRMTSEFKTFNIVGGSRFAEHKRSFHDDDIMSLSIAIYVISFNFYKSKESAEKTKKMLDAIMVLNLEDQNLQPEEIKRREASDVRYHANPYGQDGWVFGGKATDDERQARVEQKKKEQQEKIDRLRGIPGGFKYL